MKTDVLALGKILSWVAVRTLSCQIQTSSTAELSNGTILSRVGLGLEKRLENMIIFLSSRIEVLLRMRLILLGSISLGSKR